MAADTKIAGLFNLPVVCPPLCDEDSSKFFVDYVSQFHKELVENKSQHPWISKAELSVLGCSLKILQAEPTHEKIDWMPEYGCALLKSRCSSGVIALNLISLDLHKFQTSSKLSSSGYTYMDNSVATNYELLFVGTVSSREELDDIQGKFQNCLAKAKTQTGQRRSARTGKQGHQRTPAFIHALYREAFGSLDALPRGGMTDVGLHTGGQLKRDTAPPLVFYSLNQILHDKAAESGGHVCPDILFKKVVAYLGLYTSQMTLEQYKGKDPLIGVKSNAPDCLLEYALLILQATSIKAAEFSNEGLDMSYFVDWLKKIQQNIAREASVQSDLYSQWFKLPRSDTEVRGQFKNFSFKMPTRYSPAMYNILSESTVRNNTNSNLGWVAVPDSKGLEDVGVWVKKAVPKTSQDSLLAMLVIKTTEAAMWTYAKNLPVMEQKDLETLSSIVDDYREVLHKFKASQKYMPVSPVELKSREFLVVWVAFCVIHFNATRLHTSEMDGFGVPLDFHDLSHLVLSDPSEWEVVQRVAGYLNKYGTSRPLFSLKDEKSTFDMGRRVATASPDLVKIWDQEEQDALCRAEGYWVEVLRKKELAQKLRTEISDLKAEKADEARKLAREQADFLEHQRKYNARYSAYASQYDIEAYDSTAYSACERRVNSLNTIVRTLNSQLDMKNSSLKNALKAPSPVFQPLPKEKDNAMPIIFFLYMPPIFQLLSRFSFTSQQLRLPQPWTEAWGGREGSQKFDISSQLTRDLCQYSWTDYYNTKQCSQYHNPSYSRRGSDYHVLLRSVSNVIPDDVGPKTVDHLHSRSQGVWYPDQLKPRMAWLGGTKSFDRAPSGCEFNPFVELDHFIVVSGFTERLLADRKLQWALVQPGEKHIDRSRGNLPYARQNTKPSWLTKTEFFSFGNMRSHPNVQLRNILVAIQERQLPFTEPTVHVLINQALFHIGEISLSHSGPELEWKKDIDEPNFGPDMHGIFEAFYQELKDSPKQYMIVKLIGRLCNFFSHFEPRCRGTAQKLATSVYQWAEDLDSKVEASPPSMTPVIRAKQVVLYQHSMMALAGGHLIKADIALLIKMNVKSRNHFTGENRRDEMLANSEEIKYMLSQKLDDILQAATISLSMLTDALRSVFQRCPAHLSWKRLHSEDNALTQCFQARGKDGHFYAINLVTGEVLIDGLPPSRLPVSILENQLYKRTFGERNFEVVEKGGFLETRYPIFDRFYRFTKGSSLRIFEFKEDESELLELLDGTTDNIVWSKDLPKRLKSMHSHWFLRNKNLIVLRGIGFKDRSISYLINLSNDNGNNEGEVKCVEPHCAEQENLQFLTKKLHTMETLVLHHKSKALDIISKFEQKDYIHTLISPQDKKGHGLLRFLCPRYELSFKLMQGCLHCQEIAGYQLSSQQQINGTLRGFSMYLLLEETNGDGRVMIFPKGQVLRKSQGQVLIQVTNDCAEQLLWYQYKFHHRFGYIETKQSRAARMQLAALHIATTLILPDELLGMTGEERAIDLIRQCWGNRPFTKEECLLLDNIKQLAHGKSPTLSLLCRDIEMSSRQLAFLYSNAITHKHIITDCYEASAYLNNVKSKQVSSRCYLTQKELSRVVGAQARRPILPARFVSNQRLPQCPVTNHELEHLQRRLDQYCSIANRKANKKQKLCDDSFPLDIKPSSKLECDMIDELKESWGAHVNSTQGHATSSKLDVMALLEIKYDAVVLRQNVEVFALSALNHLSGDSAHWYGNAHEMNRVVGLVPTATTADLAKIAIDPSGIIHFNPMLTDDSRKCLLESIHIWLRLCVYEDKIKRIVSFAQSDLTENAIKELDTVTVWDTNKHPYWLVFEVENGIQIRQEQYKVAQHLIDNRGDVIQLNMGLGKTRVILPMLVLHYSFQKSASGERHSSDKVTRLHFLSALVEEAYRYLQNHLCASILGIKIYAMPFCRDFKLDVASITRMIHTINDCRFDGGALVVAPEHRLSLELKAKELYHNGEKDIATRIEKEIINQDIWHDILDECDELLRHRYQLIYAIGSSIALPAGANRWRAIQAIFAVLAHSNEVREYLSSHQKACKLSMKSQSEWPEVQFFDGEPLKRMLGEHLERSSPRFQEGLFPKLVDVLLSNPPHELEWMVGHPLKDDIRRAIIGSDYCPTLKVLPEKHLSDVLALRGFLAGGILCHCLLKRHRVDFGVARPGKKRLAVPFRFADTPDERSEFAHPDCAIAFTVLAYYHDGLNRKELMLALKSLMSLGKNAQRNFYTSWFSASSAQMKAEGSDCFITLDSIEKIDLTNDVQMKNMWHYYHCNMYTINFYLNYCVLPNETDQFDSRLTATSWNLAQNPSNNIVGFSGTNDNHRILPLQVRQYFPTSEKDPDPIMRGLDATNGKMLDMILKHTLGVRKLGTESQLSQSIINIINEGVQGSMHIVHAVIDCGALLAGVDLHEFSKIILNILPSGEFGGVLFYDNDDSNDWVILERSGRFLPKDISPVRENEAFAIFDEPRCRGTDLKLRPDTIALLTLAPRLCKDKLMQAAGRLRKLGCNQKLIITGGSDVFSKLHDLTGCNAPSILSWGPKNSSRATATDVLSWAMKNTVESTAAGLSNWANQGYFFATTFNKDPQLCITEETLTLEDMYGQSFTEQTVAKTATDAHRYHMARTGGQQSLHNNAVKKMVDSIHQRANDYGKEFTFSTRGCDEECERELEMEIEEEEEVEVEVPLMDPIEEKAWDFKKALSCRSPIELPQIVGIKSLPDFTTKFIKPRTFSEIKWSKKIYCTNNFAQTIITRADGSHSTLNQFLRVVNFMLFFPDESFVLLSEYEANSLLKLFWTGKSSSKRPHLFLHASLLRQSLDGMNAISLQCTLQKSIRNVFGGRLQAGDVISEKCMASLQLFSGDTIYATEDRKSALKFLLRVCQRRDGKFCPRTEAERIVQMRGLEKMFPYSDLEALCEKLLCEL